MSPDRQGPLAELRIVEMVGIGPGPLAAMLLSDLGAEIIRIDRVSPSGIGISRPTRYDFAARGRRSVALDLKSPQAVELVLDLLAGADALIEGFRPGVMERLGLGPDVCLARNPQLVFGRVTGWGQDGPLAERAGHDLNYLALTGVLDAIGRANAPPTPPLNLVGDYAGGSMMLALGVLAAVINARQTGVGQVVDAAMVDGVSVLAAPLLGLIGAGIHQPGRGQNLLDSGAPHYDVYLCADGRYLSVASIEEKFRALLLDGLGLDQDTFPDVGDRANWPAARRILAETFLTRSCAEWEEVFAGSDACVAPVLTFDEAMTHPHQAHRQTFVDIAGVRQPAPAPRFSATPPAIPTPSEAPGASGGDVLRAWGIDTSRIAQLRADGSLL